ncbi:flagellar basal body-associated protein FliL [uncultured Vibrio sp.]|uniref:flagellar basal body-associated protein FliL n=1 Tax=uncultured Vibrio sp. TaxID=114054 RepID=UPI00260D6FFF|nr:flagellar basal body-associated protein FliL [uncultured Vibrio sp.]
MPEEQDPTKKKSKILIIIIAVVVLLFGVGGALFFFLGSNDGPSEPSSQPETAVVAADTVMYVNIPQPFLFNVTGDKKERLVQIKVQLMVRDSKNGDLARYHSPLAESTLLATFASATVEQLRSPTGRVELRDKATEDIKVTFGKVVGQPVIEKVLFTDFVIQ